ncbi:MAG TPA: ATP-binding protein [Polyangiaceae bacterium]|jgi:signal transduction histidine kinase|nr:ATP-binding protein [Polyangiaceae bacterium]
MNAPVVAGIFIAWSAVQLTVGAFFLQAYTARRRELEYLLFALVCFGMAVTDAGLTGAAAIHGSTHWETAMKVVHAGAIAATAANVHFVVQFVAPQYVRRTVPLTYALAAAYILLSFADGWWQSGTTHVAHGTPLGFEIIEVMALPTMPAQTGYLCMMLADVATFVALLRAYRRGRRDVRGAMLGLAVVISCGINDLINVAFQSGTPPLFPYGFLIYGFGVADTLLVRYHRAAQQLEVTARELRHATEELTSSYLELSVVQEELFRKRQLASVGELAASIAHEVRNPLAIIVNAAANLKRQGLGAEDRNTLFQIVEEEITRLNKIVTELLRYARPVNVHREDIALGDFLKGFGEGLDPAYTLVVEVPERTGVDTVWADATLLKLAIQNLLDNCRQAMPGGGVITLRAVPARAVDVTGIRIEVSDAGLGMDSHTLHRAMDPFFTTRPSGTGLGLPIAGRIVEAHGGEVDVRSRAGEGTTVSLFIPAKRVAGSGESVRPGPPSAALPAGKEKGKAPAEKPHVEVSGEE